MTKDRLQELKRLMRHAGNDGREDVENSGEENSTTLVAFCESMRSVKLEVQELKNRVKNLKSLLSDNQIWANESTRKMAEKEIEEEKALIGAGAKRIRKNLKSMKNSPSAEENTSIILRIKEVQINGVLKELNDILRDYLICLHRQKERSLQIFKDMLQVKGDDSGDLEALLEEGKIAIFTNNLLIHDMEVKCELREAKDRRNDILKIESSILEVRNLFNELSLVVDIQQEKIEEVSQLVDDNLSRVESAKKKIFSAKKKKAKVRYRKFVAGFICALAILLVIILLAVI